MYVLLLDCRRHFSPPARPCLRAGARARRCLRRCWQLLTTRGAFPFSTARCVYLPRSAYPAPRLSEEDSPVEEGEEEDEAASEEEEAAAPAAAKRPRVRARAPGRPPAGAHAAVQGTAPRAPRRKKAAVAADPADGLFGTPRGGRLGQQRPDARPRRCAQAERRRHHHRRQGLGRALRGGAPQRPGGAVHGRLQGPPSYLPPNGLEAPPPARCVLTPRRRPPAPT